MAGKCGDHLFHEVSATIAVVYSFTIWAPGFFQHAVWQSAEDIVRNRGPDFEEQPRNIIFPEGSTEEQILLVCQARASPPATYRWSSLLPAVFLFLCKSMAGILTSMQEPIWWNAYSVQLGPGRSLRHEAQWVALSCFLLLFNLSQTWFPYAGE